jgi:hypothetical protein
MFVCIDLNNKIKLAGIFVQESFLLILGWNEKIGNPLIGLQGNPFEFLNSMLTDVFRIHFNLAGVISR